MSGDASGSSPLNPRLTRRRLLAAGALGGVGLATAGSALALQQARGAIPADPATHHDMMAVGDIRAGAFDPMAYLTAFDWGKESRLPSGQMLREYELVAEDREIEVAPGVFYPAWTYNGQVPGPTIRCTEGDRIRVRFRNQGSHPHSVHFHGIHPANMDGAFEMVPPGGSYTYEFDAEPAGLQLYHC
ncbi:MAG TPA: multicopper oxidase domain-containing protein, partial [Gemmatimonadales bacterium]|nr:multicopper oxidase domain-containing protein [Gemmatimonadales bacterium]